MKGNFHPYVSHIKIPLYYVIQLGIRNFLTAKSRYCLCSINSDNFANPFCDVQKYHENHYYIALFSNLHINMTLAAQRNILNQPNIYQAHDNWKEVNNTLKSLIRFYQSELI